MSNQVFSVKPTENIEAAEAPIGILSMNDIAREAARAGSKLEEGIARVLQVPAAICQPRQNGQRTGKERAENGQRTGKERAKNGQRTA